MRCGWVDASRGNCGFAFDLGLVTASNDASLLSRFCILRCEKAGNAVDQRQTAMSEISG